MKRKSRSAQDSSGQPKRPYSASVKNPEVCVQESHLTKEEVRKLIKEELEHAKPHPEEHCQSCIGTALKDLAQRMHSVEKWMCSTEEQICSMKKSIWELKEAVELAIIHSPHIGRDNSQSKAKNDAKNLRLQLQSELSDTLFTGRKLRGAGGARIFVALIDANTGDVVTSGPESSIKLDVVVLEGDFNKNDEDDWAPEEFENYVAKEREGKGLLLVGDLQVRLKGGVGELGEMIFTDNSSWNRSKRFRIGLKAVSGYCGNTRIREAKSNAFRVKEHRGESNNKHYPPAFDDELWRLEKIAKNGPFHHKLRNAGIDKVEDFLLQLYADSGKLRKILGIGLTDKSWHCLINHAMTCKLNWKLYFCHPDGMRKHGAVFNSDGQLIGLIKDGLCIAAHHLSAEEKERGNTIVKKALGNWNDVREFNGGPFSHSMQEESSSPFPSQVFEERIENLTPIQLSLAPRDCAASVGPEAPLVDRGSTAEGLSPGHNGATLLP